MIRLSVPVPPNYNEGVGVSYAQDLALVSQRLSFRLQITGWFLVAIGVAFALLGTTARTEFEIIRETPEIDGTGKETGREVLTLKSGPRNWFYAHMGLIFGAAAIIAAGIGWQCLDRSSAASLLAVAANQAIAHASTTEAVDADLRAYRLCVTAKSDWLKGRINHDRISNITSSFFGDGFGSKLPSNVPHDGSE